MVLFKRILAYKHAVKNSCQISIYPNSWQRVLFPVRRGKFLSSGNPTRRVLFITTEQVITTPIPLVSPVSIGGIHTIRLTVCLYVVLFIWIGYILESRRPVHRRAAWAPAAGGAAGRPWSGTGRSASARGSRPPPPCSAAPHNACSATTRLGKHDRFIYIQYSNWSEIKSLRTFHTVYMVAMTGHIHM